MSMTKTWGPRVGASLILALLPLAAHAEDAGAGPTQAEAVSYYKQVRPIFQARCQGCHQPAKPSGDYVMTTFDRLRAGGESELPAIVPHQPEESYLVEQVTPVEGEAMMPQGQPALAPNEIDLIRRWVAQGALDDTPENARVRYDTDHPPVYSRPPVITALDFSPDGKWLAVAGFHEVLLLDADGSGPLARLVGLSERIESVRFAPDGKRLAVTGGLPARMGEVQVWDVAKRKLALSVPVTSDTVYGASWSPDGKAIAFGCADNTVRAIDATTGAPVLFMGSHSDWALDTVFSADGSHVVSVGRDMTVKLTEVATQRFVDNVTSITPGALKGGVQTVARHPGRDELVVGGADGVPKVYRIFRLTKRVIGDDSNLIRELPAMTGRIFSVAVSRDGRRIAAASSLDGKGLVHVYSYEFDTGLPEKIKAIMEKVVTSRSAEEKAALEQYQTEGVRLIARVPVERAGIYAVAFRPDGVLAAAGADGTVRLIDAERGSILKEFSPAPLGGEPPVVAVPVATAADRPAPSAAEAETLPAGATLAALEVQPTSIRLAGRFDYAQLVVTGRLTSGETLDVTRMVDARVSADVAEVSRSGLVRPTADGRATLRLGLAGAAVVVPVAVEGIDADVKVDFVHDVAPILSRLGCNQGTCHGSAQGKNGFKLSLRGYDPLFDVRALTDDLASRRVNVASPDDSLMLLKPTGGVPHVGGQLLRPGEPYYQVLRDWIAAGARLETSTPKVTKLEVFPIDPVIPAIGGRQQLGVRATYADGQVRDVTREAFLESGNTEVAKADHPALITALRRGEAPILARFEGAYASTTLTVMGDRTGFAWESPPSYGRIDELVARKWERMKIKPSEVCTDAQFIRRAYLDLTGLPPAADDVRAFVADPRDARDKRAELVDRLIGNPDYVEYWTNKWADLLQVNRKFLGVEGAVAFRQWIREQVAANTPYDRFVRSILTAGGSNRENPAASYFKVLREPAATMENTTQLFLGVRFNCNKCHDHPFERWTQDQYYQTTAYFARVDLKADPASGGRTIGGTAVEGAKPLYEVVSDKGEGEVVHERTGRVTAPQFPFTCDYDAAEDAGRRQELASWLTSPDNPYFARSYVNRLWGYLFGVGIIEPLDDIRAGNPPTNPELLDYLTEEFITSGFDTRHVIRLIVKSRTYQLSVATNRWNEDDRINFSHAMARRLPAEVLLDAVYRVTGSTSKFPGVAPGTRAAALPDSGVELPSGFLTTFGRPARESACECERSSGLQLGPIMALVSGPTLGDAIADPQNELSRLVARTPDDRALVDELFLRILNRPATPAEIDACLASFPAIEEDHRKLSEALTRREAEVAKIRPEQERQRDAAIAAARAAVEAREKEIAPQVAEQERQQAERTARLEQELKDYEATLPAKQAEWEPAHASSVTWTPLDPKTLKATAGVTLTKKEDLSIVASGAQGKGTYTLVAETDLKGITAIRLEALTDEGLPQKGPGRAGDGNFVLTELEVQVAPRSEPKNAEQVALQDARADFSQAHFDIKLAIDGDKTSLDKGWAISPTAGVVHWATFETKQDLGSEGGTVLTITLHHQYSSAQHGLGRFRVSVATAPRPVGLGLPTELATILAVPPQERCDEQKAALLAYVSGIDQELQTRRRALAESRKPLPIDPTLKELRDRLEVASRPLPVDPALAQLRRDLEMSTTQLATRRLTAAQDIAWALINSPAFLFNH